MVVNRGNQHFYLSHASLKNNRRRKKITDNLIQKDLLTLTVGNRGNQNFDLSHTSLNSNHSKETFNNNLI